MDMTVKNAVSLFKKRTEYDAIDEKTFQSEPFCEKIEELLLEEEDMDAVVGRIPAILNICQYGDTSDPGDLSRIMDDLVKRGLYGVRTYSI